MTTFLAHYTLARCDYMCSGCMSWEPLASLETMSLGERDAEVSETYDDLNLRSLQLLGDL